MFSLTENLHSTIQTKKMPPLQVLPVSNNLLSHCSSINVFYSTLTPELHLYANLIVYPIG